MQLHTLEVVVDDYKLQWHRIQEATIAPWQGWVYVPCVILHPYLMK
jgi:hypothetical protein